MPLTRFAPAPTGRLHLGHVLSAIHVWGLGAREGAAVLLRIEDHDRQRSRPAFEAQLLEDLDWLGFVPDHFPTSAFRAGGCESRQSNREGIYRATARDLGERGLLYGCTCSRAQMAAPMAGGVTTLPPYPGTCRGRGVAPTDDVAWRLLLEPGEETFVDLLGGPYTQDPATDFGDPVIRDRHGNWTYQFAVVVDDFRQGVNLVIRGVDLLPSTGLQMRLARLLGRAAPSRFAHHPLLMRTATEKLSKSDGDSGIAELRAAGWSADDVIGRAAHLVGLAAPGQPLAARDVATLFL